MEREARHAVVSRFRRAALALSIAGIATAACSRHPMAAQPIERTCAEWSVVQSDAGQVSVPAGWSLGIINDSGFRATFYVGRKKVVIVVTAGPLDDEREELIIETIRASLAEMAQADLEPLKRTIVDNTTMYCASARRTPGFTGCGAVRPHDAGKELVIAFATNLEAGSLEDAGGVTIIQKTLASVRDMIEGDPFVLRKAP
jgi:hypothetical protein